MIEAIILLLAVNVSILMNIFFNLNIFGFVTKLYGLKFGLRRRNMRWLETRDKKHMTLNKDENKKLETRDKRYRTWNRDENKRFGMRNKVKMDKINHEMARRGDVALIKLEYGFNNFLYLLLLYQNLIYSYLPKSYGSMSS